MIRNAWERSNCKIPSGHMYSFQHADTRLVMRLAGSLSDMQAAAEFMAFSGDGILGKIACLRLSLLTLTHRYCQAARKREREVVWSDISCYPWMECWNARAEAACLVDDLLSRALTLTSLLFLLYVKGGGAAEWEKLARDKMQNNRPGIYNVGLPAWETRCSMRKRFH